MNKWISKCVTVAVTLTVSVITGFSVVVVPMMVTPAPAMAETKPSTCMAAPASPQRGLPVIQVLIGTTSADQQSGTTGAREAAMNKIMAAGFNMQARLLVGSLGGGVSGSDLTVNTQLQPSGPNQLFVQQNQQCKQKGVASALRVLLHTRSTGSVDVLGALQVAQSNLTGLVGTKTPVDLVMMSSMMDVSGPLNLDGGPGLAQNPQTLISRVRWDNLMPDCRGWNVYILGGGTEANGSLNDSGYEELKAFWTDFFAACGGQVVYYDNQLAQFPVKAAVRHAVRIKPDSRQQQVVMTLPGDVLFVSGSAAMSPNAGSVLAQLLPVLLQQYPNGSVQATCYTDNVPINISGGNTELSIQRGHEVADWLSQHGVSTGRIHVLGLGSTDPVASNSTPVGQAQNRRCVVAVAK